MALPNLAGQNIETTYQRIVHTDGTNYYNGEGTLLNIGGGGSTFPYTGDAVITGSLLVSSSLTVSGSLNVSQGITGSLFGTSSWAQNSISSSYPLTVTGSTLRSTYVGGNYAANITNSIFIGNAAGANATLASSSVFLGFQAGTNAPRSSNSNFIGYQAGYQATSASNSNFLGEKAGLSAQYANNSNFLGNNAGWFAPSANNSNFFGQSAGYNAQYANNSNFLGSGSGYSANFANNSNFLGQNAGANATNAYYSNFLGLKAGADATNASYSNFLGLQAGYQATAVNSSNFIGTSAGYQAASASYSNFFGLGAGTSAISASYSNFLGYNVGNVATSASYSTLIGYQVGYATLYQNSIGPNNIIIGTNITLAPQQKDSINIGGIIFATGSYFSNAVFSTPFSGSVSGAKVGIGTSTPQYTFDVSGSGRYTNALTVSGSITSTSGFIKPGAGSQYLLADGTTTSGGGGGGGSTFPYTGSALITGSLGITGSLSTLGFDATINGVTVGRGQGNIGTNTAVGNSALIVNTTGRSNVALGKDTLRHNSIGENNTAVGFSAGSEITEGSNNLLIGFSAGNSITTGTKNILIGDDNSTYPDLGTAFNGQNTLSISKGDTALGTGLPHIWAPDTVSIESNSSMFVITVKAANYSSMFVEYTIEDTNGSLRAGYIKGVWKRDLSKIKWTEDTTDSIGDTSKYVFDIYDAGSENIGLRLTNTDAYYVYCNVTSRLLARPEIP